MKCAQVDTLISRDYGCPEAGAEEEILVPWLSSTHELITNATASMPELGWWAPSCSLHTLFGHPQVISVQKTQYSEKGYLFTSSEIGSLAKALIDKMQHLG